MLTLRGGGAYMEQRTPASSLQPVNRQVDDMKNNLMILLGAVLLAAPATAAPAGAQDRMADLCSVSNTDVEGQRLAKTCRAEVRARFEAERSAAIRAQRPVRTAAIDPVPPR
jgi:hypothetical protein